MGALADTSREDFSEEGILSGARGFEYRAQQQDMAVAVAEALERESPLLVEAGTGVGKSLAYLIPSLRFALAHERKAIISTHTINLQEQLFYKDIPAAQRAIGQPINAALLKGRANYLCKTRLQRALAQSGDLFNQAETKQLYDLLAWSQDCGEGSLAELPADFDFNYKVWAQVCSENHVCTPRNCGSDCPYQAARLRVQEAQVVVLNHTLFFGLLGIAEQMHEAQQVGLKEEEIMSAPLDGFIYPRDFLILDEAHTIETVAANQLGINLGEADLMHELRRLYNPASKKGVLRHYASPAMFAYMEEAQAACEEFFRLARLDSNLDAHNGSVRLRRAGWTEDILSPALNQLEEEVKTTAQLIEQDISRAELMDVAARLLAWRSAVSVMVQMRDEGMVYWLEKYGPEGEYMRMRAALIDVSELLREKLFEAQRALILTSATLSTGQRGMNYFMGRVGAESARCLSIGSPFNFAQQMRIVVARTMPPPPPMSEEAHYLQELEQWVKASLVESQGRAFVLFTNYSHLRHMSQSLEPFCVEQGWPLFAQGAGLNRSRMLESFKQQVGSVLLGTESFWTGVDVPGEALSNVIITKIPFESPGNPLTEARIEAITARGGRAFFEYSLPEALLKFRQGVGRLIRHKEDKGVVVLLDSRITGKPYGAQFMHALPAEAPRVFL